MCCRPTPATSFVTSIAYIYRQLGIYTGRILKGEKPSELPVEQVAKIELIINLKTGHSVLLCRSRWSAACR